MRLIPLVCWTLVLATGSARPVMAVDPFRKLDVMARRACVVAKSQSVEQSRDAKVALTADGRLDVFIIGDVDRASLEECGVTVRTVLPGLCTAFVPITALDRVSSLGAVHQICGARPMGHSLDASIPASNVGGLRGPAPTFNGWNGAGVVVGSVDSGIDLDHGDFRNPDNSTRILRVWDQSSAAGPAPQGFNYGREWTKQDIDLGVATEVDTDGHGTHVMGIAAGDGSATGGTVPAFTYVGVAPKADIVMVKGRYTTGDFSMFDTNVIDGVAYIFATAGAQGKRAVANLSLFSFFGPHDGTSPLESGLSALTGAGRLLVVAAGNFRGFPWHAEAHATTPSEVVTTLVNQAVDGGIFYTDGYYDDGEVGTVRVTTPGGTVIGPITFGGENAPYPGQVTSNGRVYLWHGEYAGSNEIYLEVRDEAASSTLGTWTMAFTAGANPTDGEVDLWHGNNYPLINSGFITGSQPNEELITEPGNAVGAITVGAWTTKLSWMQCNGDMATDPGVVGALYAMSGPGPTRDGRLKPEICAPGMRVASAQTNDTSPVCPVPGNSSNYLPDGLSHSMASGTSMAAPHVAGFCALLLQRHGPITPQWIRDHLPIFTRSDGSTGAVPNNDWGWGKLDAGRVATSVEPGQFSKAPRIVLGHSSPNPFNPQMSLDYWMAVPVQVEIAILDTRGRIVRTLERGTKEAGSHRVRWDGLNDARRPLPSGVYVLRVSTGVESRSQKLVMLR